MKKNKFLFMLIVIVFICCISYNVKATDDQNLQLLEEESYTDAYKKWLKLSEHEKINAIEPNKHVINFDIDSNNKLLKAETIPSEFDLRVNDKLKLNVRDQGQTSMCWAFASSNIFETTVLKYKKATILPNYSPRHLAYATSRYFKNDVQNIYGFNLDVSEGGVYDISLAYYASGRGPILEEEMPFINEMNKIDISEIYNKKTQMQLEDAIFYPNICKEYNDSDVTFYNGDKTKTYSFNEVELIRNQIKEHIIKYGGVGSRTYFPSSISSDFPYFSEDRTAYYCDNDSIYPNHAITIIGWDDNYSRYNFKTDKQPMHDGAYLILDSHGNNFNNGFYYISYDDIYIEQEIFGIKYVSDVDYDNIYQYDYLGASQGIYLGNNAQEIYAANVFSRSGNAIEYLTEIGFYSYQDSEASFWVNNNGTDKNINNLIYVGNVKGLEYGYHTYKLDTPIEIGDSFTIVVKFSSENVALLPIENSISSNKIYDTAFANSEESYFSNNGVDFVDLSISRPNANVCLKAFTVNEKYLINNNWNIFNLSNINAITGISKGTTISEINDSKNYASGYTVKIFDINNAELTSGIITTGTKIRIYKNDELKIEYVVIIYGDTNQDGDIGAVDALAIVKNKLGTLRFNDVIKEEAGRVTLATRNSKETPSSIDALACVKYKLGIGIIE